VPAYMEKMKHDQDSTHNSALQDAKIREREHRKRNEVLPELYCFLHNAHPDYKVDYLNEPVSFPGFGPE